MPPQEIHILPINSFFFFAAGPVCSAEYVPSSINLEQLTTRLYADICEPGYSSIESIPVGHLLCTPIYQVNITGFFCKYVDAFCVSCFNVLVIPIM